MKLRLRLLLLVVQIMALVTITYLLPRHHGLLLRYDNEIFYPFQSWRGALFGGVWFSIGDVLYVFWGVGLLITAIKWVVFIIRFRTYRERLALSFLRAINTVLFIYLFFLFGWGANYYQPSLARSWDLSFDNTGMDHAAKHKRDSSILVTFDRLLVDRLNTYASFYHFSPLAEANERAKNYYRDYTDSRVRMHGLNIKPSLFTYFLERSAVDGYYNPFTGEGQVNTSLPSFMLPFLLCHEMAHQAGIAAEGDANLMAYALCTIVPDSSFNYSGYLNIWLYAHHRLYRRDSALANKMEQQLNPLTRAHIDTLDQVSRRYNNDLTHYSAEIYDDYLKMQHQKDGLRSYGNVVTSAWLLEQKVRGGVIHVP